MKKTSNDSKNRRIKTEVVGLAASRVRRLPPLKFLAINVAVFKSQRCNCRHYFRRNAVVFVRESLKKKNSVAIAKKNLQFVQDVGFF
jgi:hypothetical protein